MNYIVLFAYIIFGKIYKVDRSGQESQAIPQKVAKTQDGKMKFTNPVSKFWSQGSGQMWR